MCRLLALLCSFVAAVPGSTQPVVIFDSGRTKPIAPYLAPVTVKRSSLPLPTLPQPPIAAPRRLDGYVQLPIHTPELQPGPLGPVALTPEQAQRLKHLPRPLFLMGADALSLRWLAQQRDSLLALGAVGMLVEAQDRSDLAAVERAGSGLLIVPAAGTEVAQALGLHHYPVLIPRQAIEQ
jgi:integrating conjugative element protein (TIGR03765 family)